MANTSLDIKIKAAVEGLDSFVEARTKFNALVSDLEKMVSPSNKAGDAISTLASKSDAAADEMGGLTQQSKLLQDAIEGITGAQSLDEIKAQALNALEALTTLKDEGVYNMGALDDETQIVTREMTQLQDEINTLSVILGDLSKVESLEELQDVSEKAEKAITALGDEVTDASRVMDSFEESIQNTARVGASAADSVQSIANEVDDLGGSLDDTTGSAEGLGSQTTDLVGGLIEVDDTAQGAGASIEDLVGSQDSASQGSTELSGTLGKLKDWFDQARAGADDLTGGLRDITNVGPTVTDVVGGIMGAVGALKDKIGLLVTGIVAFAAVSDLLEAADTAARVEALGTTMEVVGRNAGYTTEQLDGYEREVKRLGITTSSARETITQMASAGLELGEVSEGAGSQVALLARASQDLAVRMGGSSSETLQQMITNIQQLDTEGLRYMGIILDVGQAQEKYALTLGTTVGALTQAQKQQAVLNEVMSQAQAQAGLYDVSMENVAKKIGSLARYKEELAEVMGAKLIPAYGKLVDNTTEYLKDLKAVIENTDEAGTASMNWADAMDGLSSLILKGMKAAVEVMSEANQGTSVLAATVGDLLGLLGGLFESMDRAEGATITIGSVIGGFFTTIAGLIALIQDGALLLTAAFIGLGSALIEAVGLIIGGLGELLGWLPFVGKELQALGNQWRTFGNEGVKASQGVMQSVIDGEGAVGKFNERILETNQLMEKAKKTGAYKTLEDEITRLLGAQRTGTLASHELAKASGEVSSALSRMAAEGSLTEKQVSILAAKLQSVGNKELDGYNKALELVGFTAQELKERTTGSFGEVTGGLQSLATNANTTSDIFYSAFSKSIDSASTVNDLTAMQTALESYQKRLEDTGALTEKESKRIREQSQLVLEKFNEVYSDGLDSARTSQDFKELYDDTERLGQMMVKAGVMTEEGLAAKLQKVTEYAEKAGKSLEFKETITALGKIGISFDELTSGVSDSVDAIVEALGDINTQAQLTSGQLRQVFDKAIGEAKTLDDLQLIKEKMQEAFEGGKLSMSDFKSGLTDLGAQFVQVFTKDLDAATTRQEIDALRERIVVMGNDGSLSATQVAYALKEISDKAKSGKQSVLELAKQLTDLGDAQLRSTQATNDAFKSQIAMNTAAGELDKARNMYAQDSTELNRSLVDLKQIEYEIAQQQYVIAQSIAELEQQNVAILISQQKLLRAEKEATMATDAAAAQTRINQIQAEIDAEVVKGEKITQNIQNQQATLSNMEAQRSKAAQVVSEATNVAAKTDEAGESAKRATAETEKFKNEMKATGNAIAAMINGNLSRSVSLLQEAGYTQEESIKRATVLQETFNKGLILAFTGSIGGAKMWWDMMESNLQDQIAYKEWLIKLEERDAIVKEKQIQQTNDITSNAQRMAELGYEANMSWKDLANEGLASTSTQLQKITATAKQAIKDAQSSVISFMSSINSIKLEYLDATGQEEEALKMRYAQRKQELALEYEMLKVQVTAAQITAKQAGISTAILDKALEDAKAGYKQALKYLEEMEKMEAAAAKKRKDEEAIAAALAAKELKEKQEDLAKNKATEASMLAAYQAALTKTLAADPNRDGLDEKGAPLHFTFEVGGKTINATTESKKEDLLSVLEDLQMRSR